MEEYKYTDIANLIGGGTPKTTEASYWDGNIPWLSVKDFCGDQKYVYTTEKSITEKGLNNSSTKLLEKDDIIISARGTVGEMAMIPFEMAFNQSCFGIRAKKDKVLPDYLYYFTKTKVRELKQSAHGSVFDTITRETFESLTCKLPCLTEQKNIVSILSCLDSKIDLNRRINDNLEQQAQALFKSWFVDFEPFKDGKFVESEMGMIPEGWKVISLQEYCQEITRGNIPTYVEKSNRPILNQKVNKGVSLEKQYYKYNSENVEVSISKMAHYGDVLLNSLGQGTLGRVHLYKEKLGNVIIDQFITILRTNLFVKSAYLSYTLNRPEYQTIIEGNVTGSTGMWVLTINNVRNIKIIVPKESCFLELAPIINSIYQAISNNTAEMEQLCTLRDCILPHLMSGELKINDLNC